MKVLMLGWEFPPFFAGGVGIVCYELTKALTQYEDLEIEYVMAYGPENKQLSNKLLINSANKAKTILENLSITKIDSLLYSYDGPIEYSHKFEKILEKQEPQGEFRSIKQIYGENLIEEVYLYSQRVLNHYRENNFHVIHAHDWTTVPAAILLKKETNKPFIFHVHITELDKTGGMGGWEEVFKIEKLGFEHADVLVTVSNYVKDRLVNDYGVNPNKIVVIHNGGISDLKPSLMNNSQFLTHSKMVLFAGRMTLQKGPRNFLLAAKRVLEYDPSILFTMIGSGDMLQEIIELSVELGISKNFFFHGKYTRDEAEEFFSRADIFVMPSVSEPFGIVPLEAVVKGTPTIITKQSGISEVLANTLAVDFWDIDEMAHKILALLKYPTLHNHIRKSAFEELDNFCWRHPAKKVYNLYKSLN